MAFWYEVRGFWFGVKGARLGCLGFGATDTNRRTITITIQ